eukprot:jgi/Mesen1/1498/ME000132S00435
MRTSMPNRITRRTMEADIGKDTTEQQRSLETGRRQGLEKSLGNRLYLWGLAFFWAGVSLTFIATYVLYLYIREKGDSLWGASGEPSHKPGEQPYANQSFIYIYELGQEFTEGALQRKPNWYSVQYDAERNLTRLFKASGAVRTFDPQQATLFFVPMYTSWYLLSIYQDGLKNMREAVESTSKAWGTLLERVRKQHPYFNRTNGRDHFGIISMDHGRCSALTFLDPAAYGDMFFLTLNGDKMVRSNHANKLRGIQALSYNYGAEPAADPGARK